MNEQDIANKIANVKQNVDQIESGGHEVNVVASGTLAEATFFDKAKKRIKEKAIATRDFILIPMALDLIYNTADDFIRRIIYEKLGGVGGSTPVVNGSTMFDYSGVSKKKSSVGVLGWEGSSQTQQEQENKLYRFIIVDDLTQVNAIFNEVNRIMAKYGNATIADAYSAAQQSKKILPTDYNYGWTLENHKNGISANFDRVRAKDANNRTTWKFKLIFPQTEELN